GRCALRAPPVLLRFSAAHKARPRRPARAFADTVVVLARKSLVFSSNTTNVSRAALGGVPPYAPGGVRAGAQAGRFRRRRAAQPRGRRAQRASYF
ncbi:MAG: hypothetical protein OZ924_17925, partial [Burkholderiaceae bacterium]|nr:hypothetical protein [Burkholderiaceae bacterium]